VTLPFLSTNSVSLSLSLSRSLESRSGNALRIERPRQGRIIFIVGVRCDVAAVRTWHVTVRQNIVKHGRARRGQKSRRRDRARAHARARGQSRRSAWNYQSCRFIEMSSSVSRRFRYSCEEEDEQEGEGGGTGALVHVAIAVET